MLTVGKRIQIIAEGIYGALRIAFTILLHPLLRRGFRTAGATEAEASATFPGDEIVPQPRSVMNVAATVHAPPERIWPWLVQLGCQRAGWYAYDLLDNGGMPSAERIIPEYQHIAVGDVVKAMPKGDFGFPVARLEPGRSLTLGGILDTASGQPAQPGEAVEQFFAGDQTFLLQAQAANGAPATRLIFRMRLDWNKTRLNDVIYGWMMESISFVMADRMVRNIKRLAERDGSTDNNDPR